MINNIKLGFKIMKYGHSAKLSIIMSIVMAVIGLLYSIVGIRVRSLFPGGYFMMMAQLLLVQLTYTVNAVNLAAASPRKKQLQTAVPALMSMVLMLPAYLLTVVSFGVSVCIAPESADAACTQMMLSVAMMGAVMLYIGSCYKYFVISSAVFVLLVINYPMLANYAHRWKFMLFADLWGNFGVTAAIGLAILLICGVLEYLISLAVYKAPISKMALGSRLRNQL